MSFDEIKGQEGAISLLRRAIQEERIATSYIFYGPEGVGKRTAALNLAKALNCEEGGGGSCDACTACRRVESGNHPDVRLIAREKGRKSIGIERIRNIESETSLPAFEAKRRVFILEEAHLLSPEAANAFLKTLEEPPEDTVFILLTDRLYSLPATVLSRSQWIRFMPLGRSLLGELLHQRKGVPLEKGELIATLCGGEVGRSLNFDEEAFFRHRALVVELYLRASVDDVSSIFEAVSEILSGKGSGQADSEEVLEILYSWCRDLLVVRAGGDESLVINYDLIEQLKEETSRLSPAQTEELNAAVKRCLDLLEKNVNKAMALVDLFLEIARIRGGTGESSSLAANGPAISLTGDRGHDT